MARFRNKPRVIEANQFHDGQPCPGVYGGFPHQRKVIATLPGGNVEVTGPAVITIQGQVVPIAEGEWVVAESDGIHHYPIKADEFSRLYEPAE